MRLTRYELVIAFALAGTAVAAGASDLVDFSSNEILGSIEATVAPAMDVVTPEQPSSLSKSDSWFDAGDVVAVLALIVSVATAWRGERLYWEAPIRSAHDEEFILAVRAPLYKRLDELREISTIVEGLPQATSASRRAQINTMISDKLPLVLAGMQRALSTAEARCPGKVWLKAAFDLEEAVYPAFARIKTTNDAAAIASAVTEANDAIDACIKACEDRVLQHRKTLLFRSYVPKFWTRGRA